VFSPVGLIVYSFNDTLYSNQCTKQQALNWVFITMQYGVLFTYFECNGLGKLSNNY